MPLCLMAIGIILFLAVIMNFNISLPLALVSVSSEPPDCVQHARPASCIPDLEYKVPNIVHYAWYNIRLSFLLSMVMKQIGCRYILMRSSL